MAIDRQPIDDSYTWLSKKALGILSINVPHVTGATGSIILSAVTRERVVVNKDITMHVTESGSYVSDHVVDKPLTIYIDGVVSRKETKALIETLGEELNATFTGLKINNVFSLIGLLDVQTGARSLVGDTWFEKLRDNIEQFGSSIMKPMKAIEDLVQYFISATTNKVLDSYKLYQKIADDKVPLTYTTQFGTYENLFITQIEGTTDTNTGEHAARVSLKLEQVKFVDSVYAPVDEALQGRIKSQFTNVINMGTIKLKKVPENLYSRVLKTIK